MKSRISIEVDFENNNQPVVQILHTSNSDDVRDKLLSHFLQSLHGSSWCQIKWVQNAEPNSEVDTFNRVYISPISPDQFKEQSKLMQNR